MHKSFIIGSALLCLCGLTGCYKDVDPNRMSPDDEACFDYEGYVPYPDVTFSVDVMPLLQKHCNEGSCHGGLPSEAKAKLWLGPSDGEVASDEARSLVLSQLVSVRSLTAEDVGLVIPAEPGQSFMMLKLDGCQNDPAFVCTPQPTPVSKLPCGDRMPSMAATLSALELDVFRSWIALGARND